MSDSKSPVKNRLHPRNKNRERYDLQQMIDAIPELNDYVRPNKYGEETIDFASPKAVRLLNQALLKTTYGVEFWDFPEENLCPPIPGRADYLHYIADLLCEKNFGKIPTGSKVVGLDIGVGASCIYPLIGSAEYGWHFIGSDIDKESLSHAEKIAENNEVTKGKIECRWQENPNDTLYGVLDKDERIDFTICNPPFHASAEEAAKGSQRKQRNLGQSKKGKAPLNFAGISNELICEGGEYKFIHNIVRESKRHEKNCFYYTTLVSKQSNLKAIYKSLDKFNPTRVKTIPMGTGNKSTRLVAWTFLNKEEQLAWVKERWQRK